MINPHWLQSFRALAEQGSFTRAADALGLTQAAVSQHVRFLEDQYGLLVVRKSRPLELTPIGQELLCYALEVAEADARFQHRLNLSDSLEGEVSLITPGSSGLLIYPALLALQQQHPGLVIRHRFAPDQEVLQAVLNNQYELGLLTFAPQDKRLKAQAIAEEPLELVHPRGTHVKEWQDLVALGFIDHPDGRAMADKLLSRHFPGQPGAATLPSKGYSNQVSLLLEPVARGLGFTILPRYARQAFVRQDEIAVCQCQRPVVDTLWAIHRAEWPLPRRCQWVLDTMKSCLTP